LVKTVRAYSQKTLVKKVLTTRQAVLITAYKNVEQIVDIINYLGDNFEFYIHIDKKSTMDLSPIEGIDYVHLFKIFHVNWGSVNHLQCILLLSEKALADKRNAYFHLITGQDFPVKPVNYFFNELDTRKDYIDYFAMPTKDCWTEENGGMDRFEYYRPFEVFNDKTMIGRKILRSLLFIQKKIKRKRKYPRAIFPDFYGGGTYWSLTRDSLQYVLDFTDKNEKAIKSMNYTFCPEEFYFQTILLNSNRACNIVNDNLRYIDWNSGRGRPAFLDTTDYEKIKSSNKLFARKFHERDSEELKRLIINSQSVR